MDENIKMTILSKSMEKKLGADIVREAMTEEEELLFILKHGYKSPFRLKTLTKSDGPVDEPFYIEYILTNIPRPGDVDYD